MPGALPSPTPDTSRRCPCAMRQAFSYCVPPTPQNIRGQPSLLSVSAYTPHTSTPTECEPHTLGTYASPCTTFPLCANHHPCPTPTHHTATTTPHTGTHTPPIACWPPDLPYTRTTPPEGKVQFHVWQVRGHGSARAYSRRQSRHSRVPSALCLVFSSVRSCPFLQDVS